MPSSNTTTQPDTVDVRGPRFAAWVTTAVLVITLAASAASPALAAVILGVQAAIFAIGAVWGRASTPTAGYSPLSWRPDWAPLSSASRPHR